MKRCVRYIPTTVCVSEKIVLKQKVVLFNGLRPSYIMVTSFFWHSFRMLNFLHVGTIANDVHFQCYLLEGIVRWDADKALAIMIDGGGNSLYCRFSRLFQLLNGY